MLVVVILLKTLGINSYDYSRIKENLQKKKKTTNKLYIAFVLTQSRFFEGSTKPIITALFIETM